MLGWRRGGRRSPGRRSSERRRPGRGVPARNRCARWLWGRGVARRWPSRKTRRRLPWPRHWPGNARSQASAPNDAVGARPSVACSLWFSGHDALTDSVARRLLIHGHGCARRCREPAWAFGRARARAAARSPARHRCPRPSPARGRSRGALRCRCPSGRAAIAGSRVDAASISPCDPVASTRFGSRCVRPDSLCHRSTRPTRISPEVRVFFRA